MRQVDLQIDPTLASSVDVSSPEVQKALAYLSTWSYSRFPQVSILQETADGDLLATYRDSEGHLGYVIGAVWHPEERKYSFHS